MKRFIVKIFDGKQTRYYTIMERNIFRAESKMIDYHQGFGRKVVRVLTQQMV